MGPIFLVDPYKGLDYSKILKHSIYWLNLYHKWLPISTYKEVEYKNEDTVISTGTTEERLIINSILESHASILYPVILMF